jgi:hypothetical protein
MSCFSTHATCLIFINLITCIITRIIDEEYKLQDFLMLMWCLVIPTFKNINFSENIILCPTKKWLKTVLSHQTYNLKMYMTNMTPLWIFLSAKLMVTMAKVNRKYEKKGHSLSLRPCPKIQQKENHWNFGVNQSQLQCRCNTTKPLHSENGMPNKWNPSLQAWRTTYLRCCWISS